jgi:hypothetical protein
MSLTQELEDLREELLLLREEMSELEEGAGKKKKVPDGEGV